MLSFIAPPFPNDDSFFCRFFINIGEYQDCAGRRMHEVDFREEESEGTLNGMKITHQILYKNLKEIPMLYSRKEIEMFAQFIKDIK